MHVEQYDSSGVYIGGTDLENPSKVFYKSNLIINDYLMKTLSTRTQNLDVILHEVGHSISLKHQDNDVASVMVGTKLTSYGAPTSLDYANVAWKY